MLFEYGMRRENGTVNRKKKQGESEKPEE